MTVKVIAYGEALIDEIVDESSDLPAERRVGGSPLNTAVALARQNVNAYVVTPISTDEDGQKIKKHLEDSGVNTSLTIETKLGTTIAKPVDDGTGTGKKVYKFEIEGRSQSAWNIDSLANGPTDGDILTISGSFALGVDSMAEVFDVLFKQGSKYHTIFFDPNVRRDLADLNREVAIERFDRWVSFSDVVKLSDDDLEWRYPDLSIEEGTEKILELGASLVVVTLGDQGSKAFRKSQEGEILYVDQIGLYIETKDTIGAGDTYMAGLIKGLMDKDKISKGDIADLSRDDLKDVMRLATEMSSYVCGRVGADPPYAEGSADFGFEPRILKKP